MSKGSLGDINIQGGKIKDFLIFLYGMPFQSTQKVLQEGLILFFRYYLIVTFWSSGLSKLDSWVSTVALFETYNLPILSAGFFAFSATALELIAPILLLLGLAGRLAGLALLLMSLVINYLVFYNVQHYIWMFSSLYIFMYGSGLLSLDNLIYRWVHKSSIVQQ